MTASKRGPRVYLEDILSAIMRIELYIADGKDAFFGDEKTQDAVIRQVSIIGEAASKLPSSMKTAHPSIPWKQIVGMRNIIIHDSADTDLPTVWNVAARDLPRLKRTIRSIHARRAA
jgi:uncharacterized protein with HEPN domain